MIYQQMDDVGKMRFINNIKDGEGVRILRKFLRDMTIEMAKNSIDHINYVGFPPFIYKEKQLHTIMAPAVADLSDAFLMESAVTREWSSLAKYDLNDSHGWVDYWCLLKNYNYYIELKHGFISYRTKEIRKVVKEEWKQACKQLDVIQEEINMQKGYAKGIFKVIFHVLPIYLGGHNEDILNFEEDDIYDIQIKAMKEISNDVPANWSGLWILNEEQAGIYEFINDLEKYPAVLFLANISEIEK